MRQAIITWSSHNKSARKTAWLLQFRRPSLRLAVTALLLRKCVAAELSELLRRSLAQYGLAHFKPISRIHELLLAHHHVITRPRSAVRYSARPYATDDAVVTMQSERRAPMSGRTALHQARCVELDTGYVNFSVDFVKRRDPLRQHGCRFDVRRPLVERPISDDDHRKCITESTENWVQVRKAFGA